MSVGFYIQWCMQNNLEDFISHISSHRVRCPAWMDVQYMIHWKEGRPPTLAPLRSKYSRRVWLSVSILHIMHP